MSLDDWDWDANVAWWDRMIRRQVWANRFSLGVSVFCVLAAVCVAIFDSGWWLLIGVVDVAMVAVNIWGWRRGRRGLDKDYIYRERAVMAAERWGNGKYSRNSD